MKMKDLLIFVINNHLFVSRRSVDEEDGYVCGYWCYSGRVIKYFNPLGYGRTKLEAVENAYRGMGNA